MNSYSSDELRTIAAQQKILLWLIVASLAVTFLDIGPLPLRWGVLAVGRAVFLYRLGTALGTRGVIGYSLVSLIPVPIIGIIPLFLLVTRASKVLSENGVRVGLMGANGEDLRKLP